VEATRIRPTDGDAGQLAVYFTDAGLSPGSLYKLENDSVSIEYERPSRRLYSVAVAPDGTVYFANANQFIIYRLESDSEVEDYTHNTYVRHVEFDSQGRLYFSEATGAGADGVIYRLAGSQPEVFYNVRLADVGGFWAGTFALDNDDNLWLSSGNVQGGSIFRVVNGAPEKVFTEPDCCIMGFYFEEDGDIVYSDHGTKLFHLTVPGYQRSEVFNYPSAEWLSDVEPLP
jgi:hypothetical protein